MDASGVTCKRSRTCSKLNGHKGRCNNEKELMPFWETSSVFKVNKRKQDLSIEENRLAEEHESKSARLLSREEDLEKVESEVQRNLDAKDIELVNLKGTIEESTKKIQTLEQQLAMITEQYEQVKSMVSSLGLDHKQFQQSKRKNNSTSKEMITDYNCSTRYRRRKETEMALQFIHGGELGSFYGAWDYIAANASKELITELFLGYRKGKHLQKIFGTAMKDYQVSPEAMKHALAMKYQNFLSRRKFTLVCRTQASYFNAEKEIWLPRNVNCMGLDLQHPQSVNGSAVDKFVKELDIGHVNQIPNAPGVSRTVTGLIFMIIDLHLCVPHLARKLIWFNELDNHFIFQFSDDGAPETSHLTMSIGSMTMWNLGDRVRSRDYQYLLHCVSLGEKHEVLEQLWKQHSDEMALLEGNRISIGGNQCTVEFQPSADMSWQSWSNNEVNQAATHPSPYANVNKGNIATMHGSIGFDENDTWKPYTNNDREKHAKLVKKYTSSLSANLKEETKHQRKLVYMAQNGIRQLGPPRIGIFAERQRPEPLHCEINSWQQVLYLIYLESVQRGKFDDFITVLAAPVALPTITAVSSSEVSPCDEDLISPRNTTTPNSSEASARSNLLPNAMSTDGGCGLSYLVQGIKEHHSDEKKRHNRIPTRLIGSQAILLARFGYRLVDSLQSPNETATQSVKRLALGRIILYLRNICSVFNKISTTPAELQELEDNCKLYFNLLCLFFPSYVNVTSWTIAYAIPYHAFKLFEMYKVGYGIISLQAKEAKHAGVKKDLGLTNRSNKLDNTGKWWQVIRANYVRSFYLPENQPMPNVYKSHFKSRVPSHCDLPGFCNCGREREEGDVFCENCLKSREVVSCGQRKELSEELELLMKPVVCGMCGKRFADEGILQTHMVIHATNNDPAEFGRKNPKDMTLTELKNQLRKLNVSISGRKDILVKRLESKLAGGC